MKFIIFKKKLP